MATVYIANAEEAPVQRARPRPLSEILQRMLAHWRPPYTGLPPASMHVTRRGWKRNSALLMSLYETRR